MTNYLVQRFLWFRERGFVQNYAENLGFALSLFPIFRNYSGDFTICLFWSLVILTIVFSF